MKGFVEAGDQCCPFQRRGQGGGGLWQTDPVSCVDTPGRLRMGRTFGDVRIPGSSLILFGSAACTLQSPNSVCHLEENEVTSSAAGLPAFA